MVLRTPSNNGYSCYKVAEEVHAKHLADNASATTGVGQGGHGLAGALPHGSRLASLSSARMPRHAATTCSIAAGSYTASGTSPLNFGPTVSLQLHYGTNQDAGGCYEWAGNDTTSIASGSNVWKSGAGYVQVEHYPTALDTDGDSGCNDIPRQKNFAGTHLYKTNMILVIGYYNTYNCYPWDSYDVGFLHWGY